MMSEKLTKVTTGLLVTTIVSGYVVSRFAPRVGMTIAWTSYLLAGATSLASAVCAFKELKEI
jgi:hypothetical protein